MSRNDQKESLDRSDSGGTREGNGTVSRVKG
ncbi:hypothetical protein ABID13_003736 [Enterocloster citroniae]|uniref:Uncharacterized protein n=1 Tax=Enterocloster citroniae TaxID=358743 RepID=A0ABV2G1C4_9FIRM